MKQLVYTCRLDGMCVSDCLFEHLSVLMSIPVLSSMLEMYNEHVYCAFISFSRDIFLVRQPLCIVFK